MTTACLVIQKFSFEYVRNITLYIHGMLQSSFGADTQLHVCDEIDDAPYADNTLVFVIGEQFKSHTRRPGCRYINLNFSIVEYLGNPLKSSLSGLRGIRAKKKLITQRIRHFDALLDYFPPQTDVLKRKLQLPVYGFRSGIIVDETGADTPLADRPYDVCFVGGISPRRQQVLDAIAAKGLKISPHQGVVFEDIVAQSKCCLNIHSQRSNHLETPRILGALSAATPVVSEACYGLETLLPVSLVVTSGISRLAETVAQLLGDPDRLDAISKAGSAWYRDTYLQESRAEWAALCQELSTRNWTLSGPVKVAEFSQSPNRSITI